MSKPRTISPWTSSPIMLLVSATSISTTLIGLVLGELLLVESGFKVFTTLLVLNLFASGFKNASSTASTILILLLLFYSSVLDEFTLSLAHVSSSILVAIVSRSVGGREAILLLANWQVVVASFSYLLTSDPVHVCVLASASLLASSIIYYGSKALALNAKTHWLNKFRGEAGRRKDLVYKLPGINSCSRRIRGAVLSGLLILKRKCDAVAGKARGSLNRLPRVLGKVQDSGIVSGFELEHYSSISTRALHTASAMEDYINLLAGNIVSSLVKTSAGASRVEKKISNFFHTISSRVERLQHEVEQALFYLLLLMSFLLLLAILFYAILHT